MDNSAQHKHLDCTTVQSQDVSGPFIHAAHWQLKQFLENSSAVMAPAGKILASIRLAEGNDFGSSGNDDGQDSMAEEWQYPGISWFKSTTISSVADELGLTATHIPGHTRYYTQTRPHEYHDWFVFSFRKNN